MKKIDEGLAELFIGSKIDDANWCPYNNKCRQTLRQICYTDFQKCTIYMRMKVTDRNRTQNFYSGLR